MKRLKKNERPNHDKTEMWKDLNMPFSRAQNTMTLFGKADLAFGPPPSF